jgi:hypothetical protein
MESSTTTIDNIPIVDQSPQITESASKSLKKRSNQSANEIQTGNFEKSGGNSRDRHGTCMRPSDR